jgi:hypothetical protein
MKRCHWVEPVLVAQVKFTEWTLDVAVQEEFQKLGPFLPL